MFIYVLSTLFDITHTGIVNYKPNVDPTLLTKRNQQRNWQVVQQLLQLRTQPIITTKPIITTADLTNFDFGNHYQGVHKIWTVIWAVEQVDLYGRQSSIDLLSQDFDKIPMVIGLEESVKFEKNYLETNKEYKNICFYTPETWDNNKFDIDFLGLENELAAK
jgi:hypothetical protein